MGISRTPSGLFVLNRESPQADGLIAWWTPLATRSSNLLLDLISWNNTIKVGTPIISPSQYLGMTSVHTNTDYYDLDSQITISGMYSIAVWVRTDTDKSYNGICGPSSINEYYAIDPVDGSNFLVRRGSGYDSFTITNMTVLGTWVHLIITEDTNGADLYVNGGMKTATASISPGTSRIITRLCRFGGSTTYNLEGAWADFRIYDHKLSEAEAYQIYAPETRWELYKPIAPPQFWIVVPKELPTGIEISNNQPCFLTGYSTGTPISDNQPVFIKGRDISIDNQPTYLIGQAELSNNKSCYLRGKVELSDNQSIYLTAQAKLSDNQPCYLKGKLEISDNQPIYLYGQALISNNQPIYLKGIGDKLLPDSDISQSGNWKNELDGTSLYPSLDEQPIPDYDDYVWHEDVYGNEYFEVGLSNPSGTPGSGDVKIHWSARRRVGTRSVKVKVELRESTTVIASQEQTLSDIDTTYFYTLTSGEKSSINNWNDLRLRFIVTEVT